MASCNLQNQIGTYVPSSSSSGSTTVDIDTRNVEVVTFTCPSMDYYQITIRGYSLSELETQIEQALQGVTAPNTFSYQVTADAVASNQSASASTWNYQTLSGNVSGSGLVGNSLVMNKSGTASSVLLQIINASGNASMYLGKSNTTGNGGLIQFEPGSGSLTINTIGQTDQLTLSASAGTVNTNSVATISGYTAVPRQTKIPSIPVLGATQVELGTFTYSGIRQVNFNFRNVTGTAISYLQVQGAAGWYALSPTHDAAYLGNTNYADTNYLQWNGNGIPLWFSTSTSPYNLSGSVEFTWLGGTSEQWSVRGMITNTTLAPNFNYVLIQGMVTCFLPQSPSVINMRVVTSAGYTGGAIYGMTF